MGLRLFLAIFALSAGFAHASELEFFGGANSTTYDHVPDAKSWGISVRGQYDWFWSNQGIFLNVEASGLSLLAAEVVGGYEYRTDSDWFFEFGLGLGFGQIFGSEIVPLIGTGYHLTQNFYVDLPLSYREGGLLVAPMLGVQF